MVERPRVMPMDASMASPAMIMIKLSTDKARGTRISTMQLAYLEL